jgi:hypothetical protein
MTAASYSFHVIVVWLRGSGLGEAMVLVFLAFML